MQLACFTEGAYSILLHGIENNKDRYYGEQDWLGSVLSVVDPYYIVSKLSVSDFSPDMTPINNDSDKSVRDLENTCRLHSAFINLTPEQATNKYMWTYLCHTKYNEYVRSRWLSENDNRQKRVNTIKERYFVVTNMKLLNDNALSRLWWYGHLTYDPNNTNDPYHLTRILFTNQTICTDVIDTLNRMNFNRIKGVLMAIQQMNDKLEESDKGKLVHLFRECKKFLNRYAAVAILDYLDSDEIQKLAYDYMLKEYHELQKKVK